MLSTGMLLCVISELLELAVFFRSRECQSTKAFLPHVADQPFSTPFVSLHVPICREPVAVVTNTLRNLANLNYQHYEVIVVYNNTLDHGLWKPIQNLCEELGSRFRFYYVKELSGYKAGALNFALMKTSEETDIVGVIDSDYLILPDYLKNMVGLFQDEAIGFVQVPQNYVASEVNFFATGCYWEYWQFFEIGMQVRAKRNAVMLHGTMCLIRRKVLELVGGWAEWCLTENSELGIRILCAKYRASYIKRSYGFGLLPFRFMDYKRQRWRWVVGGAQQLRTYVLGSRREMWRRLALKQRIYILQGWTPWLRDALIVASLVPLGIAAFTLPYCVLSAKSLYLLNFSVGVVILQHIIRQAVISFVQLRSTVYDAVACCCAIFSLTITVGLAVNSAFLGVRSGFVITPKTACLGGKYWRSVLHESVVGAYLSGLCLYIWTFGDSVAHVSALMPMFYFYPVFAAFLMNSRA